MKKFEGLSLTMALAVAGVMSGCDRGDNSWSDTGQASRVCVDQQNMRVREDKCETLVPVGGGISPYSWYYLGTLNRGLYAPGYGGTVSGGSYRASPGVSYAEAPAAGGIARGGFGATGESIGGEGVGE